MITVGVIPSTANQRPLQAKLCGFDEDQMNKIELIDFTLSRTCFVLTFSVITSVVWSSSLKLLFFIHKF